jgi:hypothetical protein
MTILAKASGKEKPCPTFSQAGQQRKRGEKLLHARDFLSLFSFWTLNQLKLDLRPLIKSLEALHVNCRVVDEDIAITVRLFDESIAFGIIEPFDFALSLV